MDGRSHRVASVQVTDSTGLVWFATAECLEHAVSKLIQNIGAERRRVAEERAKAAK